MKCVTSFFAAALIVMTVTPVSPQGRPQRELDRGLYDAAKSGKIDGVREMLAAGKARKLDPDHHETETDSHETEHCGTSRRDTIERVVHVSAAHREIPESDATGAEKERNEANQFLEGVRPLQEWFSL